MNDVICNKDLWNLPNEQIAGMVNGRVVTFILKNGDKREEYVKTLKLADIPPYLYCGFLTKDNE